MAKKKQKSEPWLGMTLLMMIVLVSVLFFILFPSEALQVIEDYLLYIIAAVALLVVAIVFRRLGSAFQTKRQCKQEEKRRKRIQIIEQLIWRGRYSLSASKAEIMADDTPEARELWQQEKIRFAKEKIFPVIPESEAPMNLVSSLIEKAISGSGQGKLPTYKVRNL